MAITKAKSSNPYDNDCGRILHAGNIAGTKFNNLTLATNAYGTQPVPVLAVSPSQSGNLGTIKALSTGAFASQEKGEYVGKIIGDRIAKTDNTVLRGGNAQFGGQKPVNFGVGNRAYGINNWNYRTGVASFNSLQGSGFTYWSASGNATIGAEPQPTKTVPGKVTFMVNGIRPTLAAYKSTYEG